MVFVADRQKSMVEATQQTIEAKKSTVLTGNPCHGSKR
jgi:hypothetical protein